STHISTLALPVDYPWAVRTVLPPNGLSERHVPLGAEAPTEGRQLGGECMRRF
ncbi:unnamed protein product, partial [Brassica oleracea]